MKTFIDFSIKRENFLLQLGVSNIKQNVKTVTRGSQFLSLLRKPRIINVTGCAYFPAVLVSNGALSLVNSGLFGVRNSQRSGTLLFEDCYSERGRWGWF